MNLASCYSLPTWILLSTAAAAQTRKLNAPLPLTPGATGGDVATMELAPDDTRIVYLAREAPDERPELRSLLLEGTPAAVKLTATIPQDETIQPRFQITPDGTRVV